VCVRTIERSIEGRYALEPQIGTTSQPINLDRLDVRANFQRDGRIRAVAPQETMKIHAVRISKDALMQMSGSERKFFLLVGHFFNELILLSKLAFMTAEVPSGKIPRRAGMTHALFVDRMLAGKLCEGWTLIRERYQGTSLSKEYDKLLDTQARRAVKNLNRYFGKSNLLSRIRNRFAFHYDPSELVQDHSMIADLRDDELEMYLSEENLNSFYYISESFVNIAMLREAKCDDINHAFKELSTDIIEVQGWFLAFVQGFMVAAARRYSDFEAAITERVDIEGTPLERVRFPFFVETSSYRRGRT
jgi:hypothetical protein